jgi:hypothetical protein
MALRAIVDRIEGDKIVLIITDGQQLIADKSAIDEEVKEGQSVLIKLQTNLRETKANQVKTRNLLKAISKQQGNESYRKAEKNQRIR